MLSEWMKITFFPTNPIDSLLIRTKREYVLQKYLDNMHVEDMEQVDNNDMVSDYSFLQNSYPEKYFHVNKRAKIIQNRMYWDSRKSNYGKYTDNNNGKHQKIAILAFSHGAVIKNFTEIINHNIKP